MLTILRFLFLLLLGILGFQPFSYAYDTVGFVSSAEQCICASTVPIQTAAVESAVPVPLCPDRAGGASASQANLRPTANFIAAETAVANPVPATLARVIPGAGPFPTLGLPGSADVFVTDAAAIEGMTPAQIAQRLAIEPSDTYTIIRFSTPESGVASPILRTNPGFTGGGLTGGGAPEFVIPNGPIPPGATTTVIGPH